MNGFEILLAFLESFRVVGFLFALVFGTSGVMCFLWWALTVNTEDKESLYRILKISSMIFFISLPVAMIPRLQDIWEVRIALIKLQLSSPENLGKGVEEIHRIGKKLECKYLGCIEDGKK